MGHFCVGVFGWSLLDLKVGWGFFEWKDCYSTVIVCAHRVCVKVRVCVRECVCAGV